MVASPYPVYATMRHAILEFREALMTTATIDIAEETAARWRTTADADNPAGPLYSAGIFAEADIIAVEAMLTLHGCSACTASSTSECC